MHVQRQYNSVLYVGPGVSNCCSNLLLQELHCSTVFLWILFPGVTGYCALPGSCTCERAVVVAVLPTGGMLLYIMLVQPAVGVQFL
jgi:hypothetical protein